MKTAYEIKKETAIFSREISKACLDQNPKMRARHCMKALEYAKTLSDDYVLLTESYDDLVAKAARAAETVKIKEDWIELLGLALGSEKENVFETAIRMKDAIDWYKERCKEKEIKE